MNTPSPFLRWLQTPLLLLAFLFAVGNGFAQSKDSGFPEFENEFFNDYTGTCTPAQKIDITRNLRLGSESSQIHTMIIAIRKMADYPTLPQEPLAFASRLAQERKIGSQKTHQGILVLFSFDDKKYAVARSTTLPQSLSDSIREALSTRMRAKFRDGQYGQSLVYAAEDIASSLPKAGVKPKTQTSSPPAPGHAQGAVSLPPPAGASTSGESGGLGLGSVLLVVVGGVALCSILSRLFSGGGGGGFGMGGGSGLGGLLGGLLGGGLLGYWLGNSSSHSGGGFFGSNTDSGGSSEGSSSDSSDSGGFDSFGGGDFGSGGDGGGSGSEGDL